MPTATVRLSFLLLLLAGLLSACAEQSRNYAQRDPYYQDPYYQQQQPYYPPPQPQYQQPQYQQPYVDPRAERQAYEERRKRVQINCNMGYTNCINPCNQPGADPRARRDCLASCNRALNQCLQNF